MIFASVIVFLVFAEVSDPVTMSSSTVRAHQMHF